MSNLKPYSYMKLIWEKTTKTLKQKRSRYLAAIELFHLVAMLGIIILIILLN